MRSTPVSAVAVSASQAGILKMMRDAFTSHTTVLHELMQNARRAGATRIEITHDLNAKVLEIVDDGRGIDDFAVLLEMATSGWDTKTKASENAFGAGFFSAIYGCAKLCVESKGRGFLAETDDMLAGKPIELYDCDEQRTRVKMIGMSRALERRAFDKAARGFPVPVFLNGEELDRPHALSDAFVAAPFGRVRFGGCWSRGCVAYLQGFVVADWASSYGESDVVHLDSTQFRARAPDRDCLIDADDARKAVTRMRKALWLERYTKQKADGCAESVLLDAHADIIAVGGAHLLNDLSRVSSAMLGFCDLHGFEQGECDYRGHAAPSGERASLASAPLVPDSFMPETSEDLASFLDFPESEYNAGFDDRLHTTQYLELLNAVHLESGLHAAHWVFRLPSVVSKPIAAPQVELIEALPAIHVSGRCIAQWFVPCKAIRYSGSLGSAESSAAIAIVPHGTGFALAVGENADLAQVCRLLSSFTDNDQWMEDWYDDDRETLSTELAMARTGDVTGLLRKVLADLHYRSAGSHLKGKRFVVEFRDDAKSGDALAIREVKQRGGKATAKAKRRQARRKAA